MLDPTTAPMTTQAPSRPSAIAIAKLERQLEDAEAMTHIGSWEWNTETGDVTWSRELYRIYGLEPGAPISLGMFYARVHPDDQAAVREHVEAVLRNRTRSQWSERIVRADGSVRQLESTCDVRIAEGEPMRVVGTCRDVTEERAREAIVRRIQELEVGERRALEMLANGARLQDILETLALQVEALLPDALVSIQTLDETGTRIRNGAAPSLPEEYNREVEGLLVGPIAGSCGTAVYRRERVVVEDIEQSPLWAPFLEITRKFGLRACWSSPLIGSEGSVIGTFAVYYRKPCQPDDVALDLVARASHVAGIVIERRQLDDRLRALTERIESIREDERTRIAREVHDELGQALTALKMDIAWVSRRLAKQGGTDDTAVEPKLVEMARATDDIIGAVRRISAELRPGILDDLGLEAAVEWLLEDFQKRTGIATGFDSKLRSTMIDRAVATTVFRICQEALTNVTRHAKATRVDVTLALRDGLVELEVADDGVGLPELSSTIGSLGLLGMRERARRLGGECEVRRRTPSGTVVHVQVPRASERP